MQKSGDSFAVSCVAGQGVTITNLATSVSVRGHPKACIIFGFDIENITDPILVAEMKVTKNMGLTACWTAQMFKGGKWKFYDRKGKLYGSKK